MIISIGSALYGGKALFQIVDDIVDVLGADELGGGVHHNVRTVLNGTDFKNFW